MSWLAAMPKISLPVKISLTPSGKKDAHARLRRLRKRRDDDETNESAKVLKVGKEDLSDFVKVDVLVTFGIC